MHGNVTEWVQDTYSDDDILPGGVDPVVNIAGEYKMYRGGSYRVNEGACTIDDRFYEKATAQYNTDLGFRLVKNL